MNENNKPYIMTRSYYIFFIILIGGISALNPVSLDVFLPAIPAISKELAVAPGIVGMSVGIYALGTAIGQLFYGPASDKYGRKPALIFGLVLFIFGALAAVFSTTFEWLALARFIQGLGAASGRILAIAIIRDKYDNEEASRLLSYMMGVSGVMPIIGPLIGSVLISHLGWPSVFIYMALFGFIVAILSGTVFLETLNTKNSQATNPVEMINNFKTIAQNQVFIRYTICGSLSGSGLYVFLSSAPEIIINTYEQGVLGFSYLFAFVMTCNAMSAFLGGRLVMRYGIHKMLSTALLCSSTSTIILFALSIYGFSNVIAIILPFTVFKMSDTIIGAQSTAKALGPFPDNAGAASSLIGFIRQSIGATAAILVGFLSDGTAFPLAIGVLIAGVLPGIMYLKLILNLD